LKNALEILASDANRCGEAPTWDAAENRLVWVDADGALVFQFSLSDNRRTVISRGLPAAGIALNRNGGMIIAGRTGLHLWRAQDDYVTLVAEHEGQPMVFNDLIADPSGRIYAGTYYWGANGMEKTGKLYLIAPDASIRVMDEGMKVSNGLGFSPGNRILYYADSGARRIYAYDVDAATGNLKGRRIFVDVPPAEGIPDGLTVDADGFIWCAQWYGGQVVRYDPDGKIERRLPLPVKQVSSVAFGGADLTDLYITSAADCWPSDLTPPGFDLTAPMGGSLYRIHLDTPGKPEHMADFHWPARA
jgi:D-xylonolactonase